MRNAMGLAVFPATLVTLMIWVFLPACGRQPAVKAPPGRVTIVYTGGIQGTLEPCGCSPGQLGGIPRIATLLKAIRKDDAPVILIDAGERLFQETDTGDANGAQRVLKAEFIQKAYGALGAAAVNLGAHDLAGGMAQAIEGAEAIGAAPLSANLSALEGAEERPAMPSKTLETGGVRVTFVGVADPASLPDAMKEFVRAEDPLTAVRDTVEALRGTSDVIVVLSTLPLKANLRLARKVAGIDLVIGAGVGGEEANLVKPRQEGEAFVVQVKPQGEFVGRLDVAPAAGKKEGLQDVTAETKAQGLLPEGASAPEGIRFGDDLDLRGGPERPTGEARRPVAPLPPVAPGGLRHSVYAIGDYLSEDPGMQRLMNEYKLKVADMNRNAPVTAARLPTDGASYTGSEACESCHEDIYAFVNKIAHARAYATLEEEQSEYDLECVGCHVTGWKKPGGFDHPAAVGDLKDVQCEACHGPGSVHVEAGGARGVGDVKAEVPLSVCRACHTPEHSTQFAGNEAAYMDTIRCSQAIMEGVAAARESGTRSAGPPPGR